MQNGYRQVYRTTVKRRRRLNVKWLVLIVVIMVLAGGAAYGLSGSKTVTSTTKVKTTITKPASQPSTANTAAVTPKTTTKTNPCATNTLDQLALISISQRHMWNCNGTTVVYDSPVITGQENLAADLTPTGTYHIYAKAVDLHLRGSDSTGSWDDPVSYWMPFLDNKYGTYGFHDATWRADSEFGNVDPYSSNGSHGCVELPLAAAKWLYNWASVGTTVTIVT